MHDHDYGHKAMIEFRTGDILNADAEALVNAVNCVGVMGRGVALLFKKAFPENFKAYAAACARGQVQPGRMFVFETDRPANPKYVINFPTKRHWREGSRMEDIEIGLIDLAETVRTHGIRSIALPALGCGLGGLNWNDVRPRIESAMHAVEQVQAMVFEPHSLSETQPSVYVGSLPRTISSRR
ncbi:MAG: type II toxin-antitoxin system antitoxin DNA ADP-ribosyl glycohydrolase DarG [Burkholderiales bacterium]